LKLRGGADAAPVASEARLKTAAHIYNLRTRQYLGFADRFQFTLDPLQPSLFALLPEKGLDSLLK
jgi:hypothetical protein